MADALKGVASGAQDTVSSGANTVSSGAQQAGSAASNAGQQAGSAATGGASSGQQKWDAMSEEQKKKTFDSLPEEKKEGKSYYEWIMDGYHHKYENWMPWIEDQYLRWFTNDNKASYATKDTLDKSKVTGIEQVDTLQDGVNSAVGQQVGKGGILQPVGDMASKEGVNRAERGGKGENESAGWGQSVMNAGSGVASGVGSAGSYVGGMFGGGGKEGEQKK